MIHSTESIPMSLSPTSRPKPQKNAYVCWVQFYKSAFLESNHVPLAQCNNTARINVGRLQQGHNSKSVTSDLERVVWRTKLPDSDAEVVVVPLPPEAQVRGISRCKVLWLPIRRSEFIEVPQLLTTKTTTIRGTFGRLNCRYKGEASAPIHYHCRSPT